MLQNGGEKVKFRAKMQMDVMDAWNKKEINIYQWQFLTVDDAIEGITLDQQSDLIYNLDGVKVDNNYRGISIRNGKKILVK